MQKYIDIHSHLLSNPENDIFRICSFDPVMDPFFNTEMNFSAGVHPWSVNHQHVDWFVWMVRKLSRNEHCLAIGECGLDYYHSTDPRVQKEIFIRHYEISETSNLPLIIHCVRAFHDLLKLRKELKPEMQWIIHGFSKSSETAKQCLDSGCALSFGKKVLDSAYVKVLKVIPDEMIFFETDDDDVDIRDLYHAFATLRNLKIEDVVLKIKQNFQRCFNIIP